MKYNFVRIISFLLVVLSTCSAELETLNENNWEAILKGEWMVEFFAPWCPACKSLQPTWEDLAKSLKTKSLNVKIGQVDVTASPGLSGRFMVTALPTIFHVKNKEFRQYRGSRDINSFISFLEEKKWEKLEVVPSWKSPASYQMGGVSFFFKLSNILRSVHTRLLEDYGMPAWGSYLIFAIATIFFGAILGLMVVLCIDFFYPPKVLRSGETRGTHSSKVSKESEDEDDVEDEIVDESEKLETTAPVRKRRTRKAD